MTRIRRRLHSGSRPTATAKKPAQRAKKGLKRGLAVGAAGAAVMAGSVLPGGAGAALPVPDSFGSPAASVTELAPGNFVREHLCTLVKKTPIPAEALVCPPPPIPPRAADLPPTVSGGEGSLAPYGKLDMKLANVVNGTMREAEIRQVVTGPVKAPIRVAVGLAHGPTPEARAQLAFDELKRLGGFDRKHLLVIVPTTSGYVNPNTVGAVELMSGGDVASVVIQYHNGPSVLSLHKIDEGAKTVAAFNKLLDAEEAARAAAGLKNPERGASGESAGAWAFTDASLANRQKGPPDANYDNTLLVGTPGFAKYYGRVLEMKAAQRAEAGVGRFHSVADLEADPTAKDLEVLMFDHDGDPVARLDWDLVREKPEFWPDGIPYRHVGSFFTTLISLPGATKLDPSRWSNPTGHFYDPEVAAASAVIFFNQDVGNPAAAAQVDAVNTILKRRAEQGMGTSPNGLPTAPALVAAAD